MIQGGDPTGTGKGGESIYGGKFEDECHRDLKHTGAGILSMANAGENSNGSQFFITLKRCPQLDGRHIAFGQVVEGMDVIRAVAQVPIDRDEKPRVSVMIVGCGQVGSMTRNQADPRSIMSQQIADLGEEVAPTGAKVPEAVKAKAILAGKQGGAVVTDARGDRRPVAPEETAEEGAGTAPARNERERRLYELRLRMNQGRASNGKEVVEEQKRSADPDYGKKKAEARHKRSLEAAEGQEGADAVPALPEGKAYLLDTLESTEMREAKKKKKHPDAFGWDVFNQDSLYRAHDKRLVHIQFDEKAYNQQKEQLQEDQPMFAGFGFKASEEAKDRLSAAMDNVLAKKKDFSRRRDHCDEEDVTYVNERNRHFNKKIQRAFGSYTEEIRQNLERGTAL